MRVTDGFKQHESCILSFKSRQHQHLPLFLYHLHFLEPFTNTVQPNPFLSPVHSLYFLSLFLSIFFFFLISWYVTKSSTSSSEKAIRKLNTRQCCCVSSLYYSSSCPLHWNHSNVVVLAVIRILQLFMLPCWEFPPCAVQPLSLEAASTGVTAGVEGEGSPNCSRVHRLGSGWLQAAEYTSQGQGDCRAAEYTSWGQGDSRAAEYTSLGQGDRRAAEYTSWGQGGTRGGEWRQS